MKAFLDQLFFRRAHRRASGKRRREAWADSPFACETLEVRVVMSAAPVVVAPAIDNPASDFTYSLWNGGIAIWSYKGPGGTVQIPATIEGLPVTQILGDAFYNRRDVTSVILPEGVVSLHEGAFTLSGITSITIPASVNNAYKAFTYADSLQSINVAPGNAIYSSVDGVLFSEDKIKLYEYPAGREGAYSVPAGVVYMEQYAFAARNKLTSITLPSTLSFVPEYAFAYCQNLRAATIAEGVSGVGQFAFRSCPSLTRVTLPKSTEFIGYAFFDCPKLRFLDGPATAPSNLRAGPNVGGGGVRLTWQPPPLPTDRNLTFRHYQIEYSGDSGKTWRQAPNVPASATSVVITGLYGPRKYAFRVTAVAGFPYAAPYNTAATVRGQAATTTAIVFGRFVWPR
jgi:hypothetical protein